MKHSVRKRESNQQTARKSGFTLIELLVVIAIIALLAAILFPVFARARENARRASCQSNMKQMALGALQYIQDYDSRYPGHNFGLGPQATPAAKWVCNEDDADQYSYWFDAIYPYVKSVQLFACPSEGYITSAAGYAHPNPWTTTPFKIGAPYTNFIEDKVHYSANKNVFDCATLDSQLSATANTFMIFEADPRSFTVIGRIRPYSTTAAWTAAEGTADNAPRVRHFDGENYAFCDGHVKWLKRSSVTLTDTRWDE